MERKYSVAEIDRMRAAIDFRYMYGCRRSEYQQGQQVGVSRTFYPQEKAVVVEDQLRTYMLAGIDPEELE